jgi:hypothetical protein
MFNFIRHRLTFGKFAAIALGLVALAAASAVQAQTPPTTDAKEPAKPASWFDTFSIGGHVEGGVTYNSRAPSDGNNFGNLFNDRADTALLNQAMLTIQRPLDPKATGFDFGFKLQGMYGTDARYTHFLGEFDQSINAIGQIDIVEANLLFHLPILTSGGIDLKIGQYASPMGAEVISAPDNPLYSHSYIFFFGLPFKHTGVLTTTHVNDWLDVYAGLDSGMNTSLGCCSYYSGDNNTAWSFLGGFGLNGLADGALNVVALTHIGAENPNTTAIANACNCNPNSATRFIADIVATWTVNDKWTLITELNWIRDDGFAADGYGVAQYATYKINDIFKVAGRAEIWRDNNGFFVASFPGNFDYVKAQHGDPTAVLTGGGITTYSEITLGLNITPPLPSTRFVKALMIRPEVRYDTSLNYSAPFAAGTASNQFTFAADVIVKF